MNNKSEIIDLDKGSIIDLEKTLRGTNAGLKERSQAISGLGRALSVENLKDKAKQLLIEMALFDGYQYWRIRELALKELKSILEDSDVKEIFEKIIKTDSRVALRFKALNYLDKIDEYGQKTDIEILKNIISSFDISDLTLSEGRILDYILWDNGSLGYQALCHFDESLVAKKLLEQFSKGGVPSIHLTGFNGLNPLGGGSLEISGPAHLYSILKFIGVHTADQNIFSEILSTLVDVCGNSDLGCLESLSSVLAHLKNNTLVSMPDVSQVKISSWLFDPEPKTAFGLVVRASEYKDYKIRKVDALIGLIKNESIDTEIRRFAIHSCAEYFFTEHDYGWVQHENAEYAKKIEPTLLKLINTSKSQKVSGTALELLSVYGKSSL